MRGPGMWVLAMQLLEVTSDVDCEQASPHVAAHTHAPSPTASKILTARSVLEDGGIVHLRLGEEARADTRREVRGDTRERTAAPPSVVKLAAERAVELPGEAAPPPPSPAILPSMMLLREFPFSFSSSSFICMRISMLVRM